MPSFTTSLAKTVLDKPVTFIQRVVNGRDRYNNPTYGTAGFPASGYTVQPLTTEEVLAHSDQVTVSYRIIGPIVPGLDTTAYVDTAVGTFEIVGDPLIWPDDHMELLVRRWTG